MFDTRTQNTAAETSRRMLRRIRLSLELARLNGPAWQVHELEALEAEELENLRLGL